MTVFFMAGEPEAFDVVGTIGFETIRTDLTLTRGAMVTSGNGDNLRKSVTAVSSGQYWTRSQVHYETSPAGSPSSNRVRIEDSGGVSVVDINWPSAGAFSQDAFVRYRNPSNNMQAISQNIGQDISNVVFYMDIKIDFNANTISFFKDDQLLFESESLDFTNIPDAETIRYMRIQGFGRVHVSQIIIANEATINMRVKTLNPDGNGAVQGWDAGDFTDIDDTILDTGTVIESGTAGQEATFTQPGIPNDFSDRPIRGVSFVATARQNGAGPSNLDVGYRHDGVQFYPGTIPLQAGFISETFFVDINAGTGLPFTVADVNALELAYRSAT